ncbi:porin family protein [Pedobacter metabolipauper]|uniref:Outer membrane protein with beta-barrel domain n=1 Tax=Pedobacter metabolipauper TaxID=425513 RepID=A0A4R6SWD6_9SPHI|nr:porin family protein [Pedobacter metabolipauper]TDQ09696.1 outer membrane protein with beta-barrel domain [Pedobacter metabolipauper]
MCIKFDTFLRHAYFILFSAFNHIKRALGCVLTHIYILFLKSEEFKIHKLAHFFLIHYQLEKKHKLFTLMKKIIILALGLFAATAANAQEPIRFGIKAGVNLPNIIKDDGNNNFDTKLNPGFNAGITLDIGLIKGLAFTPELLYATKGYKAETSFGEFTQTTHFIDIPILATINLGGSGLNLVVGPQVSFLTSTKNKFDNGFGTVEQQFDEDSDKFKKSLLGGLIGFRYDINDKVDLHGRYALDFQKNNEDGTTQTPEFKNQVFSVGFGYKF